MSDPRRARAIEHLMGAGIPREQAAAMIDRDGARGIEVIGRNAAISIIDQHIPSLSDDDEADIDDLVTAYSIRLDEAITVGDLALRTCHCGKKIDGFYEYVDHLKEVIKV